VASGRVKRRRKMIAKMLVSRKGVIPVGKVTDVLAVMVSLRQYLSRFRVWINNILRSIK